MSVIKKEPCAVCGSTDNLVTHDNGSQFCYTPNCESNKRRTNRPEQTNKDLLPGTHSAIPSRRISQRTCEFFNYQVGVDKGESVQIANYKGAQKVRTKDKKFYWKGSTAQVTLFGKDKWNGGKTIIITEGEIDALSIGEAQDCKWPVVSLPNGAQSARKTLQSELAWLLSFQSVILCFDKDDAGQTAVQDCIDLFPPGKLKIASLSEKDANECLQKGKFDELAKIVFNAQEFRPDGIVWGSEIDWAELRRPKPRGLSLPYPALDEAIRGLKDGRIYTIMAGTGCGKSTCMREIALHVKKKHNTKVANIFLEESLSFTANSYLAMNANIPAFRVEEDPTLLTTEQEQAGKNITSDMGFYRHFGSLDSKYLFNLLDYMVIGHDVKLIMLDHISLLVSGMRSESGEGERRDIDILMTNLRTFCERTQAIIVCATQLKRKEKSYASGANITESDSRGSGAIEHISDVLISLNCNIDSPTPYDAQIKVIKNRITGFKGDVDLITYDSKTGRYLPKTPTRDLLSSSEAGNSEHTPKGIIY